MKTRVSVYALAVHDGCVLLTQLAAHCTRGGSWTLPGGGIDHGEQPIEALMREVHEETGLIVLEPELFHATSYSETTARGPYLAVQLIYRVPLRGEPRVVEAGGTTAAVAWVPMDGLDGRLMVPFVAALLADL